MLGVGKGANVEPWAVCGQLQGIVGVLDGGPLRTLTPELSDSDNLLSMAIGLHIDWP